MGDNSDGATAGRTLSWASLVVIYIVWGTTYLAIRVGVRDVPPLFFAGLRFIVAGALLYPFARRSRHTKPASAERSGSGVRAWIGAGVVGVLLLAGGNGGVTYAETRLPSGLSALFIATVPLWMTVFSRLLQHHAITWRKVVGLVTGLGGVAILLGNVAAKGHLLYIVVALGAAVCWGLGSVLSYQLATPDDTVLASAIEMLVGGIALLAVAGVTGEFGHVRWSAIAATSWISWVYLVLFGSILAFTAYQYALTHLPITTVSTYAFVNPVVALFAGAIFLGERITLRELAGAALVVASIIIIQTRGGRVRVPATSSSSEGDARS